MSGKIRNGPKAVDIHFWNSFKGNQRENVFARILIKTIANRGASVSTVDAVTCSIATTSTARGMIFESVLCSDWLGFP